MPIARDDRGFMFWPDSWGAPSLGLESACLAECVNEVQARGLRGVFGNTGFKESDLDCLLALPGLTSLQLSDITLRDLTAIYGLERLSHFRISGKRPPISFERLTQVENLVVEHHAKDTGIANLTRLRMLNLWRFKAKANPAYAFPLPESLEQLGIYWSDVESLRGFGTCPNVKQLEVARCRNLQSLGDLTSTFPNLEHLVVDACGRLSAQEARRALGGHSAIKFAVAGKQLIVAEKS